MKNLGIYYGATLLDETDLVETSNRNKIELEYYGTEEHGIKQAKDQVYYGISIIKKEYEQDKVKFEKNTIERVSTNESKVIKIIETLKNYKVTPIGLEDVLKDLLKQPSFQEN